MLPEEGERYNRIAEDIASHLAPVFGDPNGSGWLLAATGVGRQPDVWGTLFALLSQRALAEGSRRSARTRSSRR